MVSWCYILLMAKKTTPKSPGRPRKDPDQRVADYPRVNIYITPAQKARVTATAELLGRSASSVMADAFDGWYKGNLTPEQRAAIEAFLAAKEQAS